MANPRPPARPRRAMVLAAGLGTRMRPITERMPKPLIEVGGKPLIDHALDRLASAEVELAVVNIHHFADQMQRHLASRRRPKIFVSDERGRLPAWIPSRRNVDPRRRSRCDRRGGGRDPGQRGMTT